MEGSYSLLSSHISTTRCISASDQPPIHPLMGGVSGGGLREPHPKPSLLTTGTHGGLLLIAFSSYQYHPLHFCKRPTTLHPLMGGVLVVDSGGHSPSHLSMTGTLGRPYPTHCTSTCSPLKLCSRQSPLNQIDWLLSFRIL